MIDLHLTTDDMPLFTKLRMTAFGEAVIEIANDPACDEWTFSQKIRHALEKETAARSERRMLKLLKASRTPNPAACVEDIRYLDGRTLHRDVVARLAACKWIEQTTNLLILGSSSVGKSYLAQALVNAACRAITRPPTIGSMTSRTNSPSTSITTPQGSGSLKHSTRVTCSFWMTS